MSADESFLIGSERVGANTRKSDRRPFRSEVLIGGEWLNADSNARMSVMDPATGREIGSVPMCGADETRKAIASAKSAFPAWAARAAIDRARILENWYRLILDYQKELAELLTSEQGKPLREAAAEIEYAASFVKWFAEEARRVEGYMIPAPGPDRRILVAKVPVGVCAAITPWNFPAAMITRKVAPALAAGCSIIVKPAEDTPLTALAIATLAEQAGIPAGVLNVITGNPIEIGGALTSSPDVRKISFTGSTRVGSELMRQCAGDIKRLSLELGGNAPFIIFDDADLDAAIEGLIANKFRNAGQTCVCANRILVQDTLHDRFVSALAERMTSLKIGRGTEPDTALGPLISDAAVTKVDRLIEDARTKGADVRRYGSLPAESGSYYVPTLVIGANDRMMLADEEVFGPVAPIFRFSSEHEAVNMANNSVFGLAAYVYTQSAQRSWRMLDALEVGMIGLNSASVSLDAAPFGGIKSSGLGREGGREGIDEYLDTKAMHWGGLTPLAH